MKKISTLLLASLFTMAAMATDRKPTVTVQASKSYEIVIDGKSYFNSNGSTMNIANLRDGYHSVSVYKTTQGLFFRKTKKMISSSSFTLRGNDISIRVDQFGKVQVTEIRFQKDDRNRDKKDQGRNDNKGYGNDKGNQGKNDHGRF